MRPTAKTPGVTSTRILAEQFDFLACLDEHPDLASLLIERHMAHKQRRLDTDNSPLDFMAKLAALVPTPGVNLTRYHGVLAPNSADRATVVPSGRGKQAGGNAERHRDGRKTVQRKELGWTARLKRVFKIDVSICASCGAQVRIIAQIDNPEVIEKILAHVYKTGKRTKQARGPPSEGRG